MKYLVVRPYAGLGNRLRALTSAMRAAKILGRQLAVIWTLDNYHLFCPFELLFENKFLFVTEHFLLNESVQYFDVTNASTFLPKCDEKIIYVRADNFIYVEGDEDVMTGQFGPFKMRNATLRDELLECFDLLKPSRHILSRVDEFIKRELPVAGIGVHVRREDNTWSNKHCHESEFIFNIKPWRTKFPGKIFLATDSSETERIFRQKFGSLVVTYPVRSFERGSDQRAIEDALVVMLILARTKLLLRSCSSTFSQCSAWFGRGQTLEIGKLEHQT